MMAIILIAASFIAIAATAGMVPASAKGDALLGGFTITLAVCGIAFATLAIKATEKRNSECLRNSTWQPSCSDRASR